VKLSTRGRYAVMAMADLARHTGSGAGSDPVRLCEIAARQEISLIKFFVAGVLHKVLDRAIQTHGALGLTNDSFLSYLYRHERGARIYDGPDEVHKSVVARMILKEYGVEISI